MTISIRAHFDGKAFIPDEPVNLPVNKPLTLSVDTGLAPEQSITGEELARSGFTGLWKDRTDIGDSLEYARKLRKEAETRRHD